MRRLREIFRSALTGLAALALVAVLVRVPRAAESEQQAAPGIHDWNQLGGSPSKNNVAAGPAPPIDWSLGRADDNDRLVPGTGVNIKWVVDLEAGSWPPGMASGPAVAAGKVFVGSNNSVGYVPRLPKEKDLSCLLCFREADGKFLWQFASERLPTGRVQDWPLNALASMPYIEADRLWIVSNRDEIVGLDIEGFADGENDGPYRDEPNEHLDEADIVWKIDLRKQFGVSPHNLARSSITAAGDVLFVGTSNGVDESHIKIPSPDAPSFLALDKNTGHVLWSFGIGKRILRGQWSSPALGTLAGKPQVLFGGGDGWLYSFRQAADKDGQPQPLWKFDCNAGWVPAAVNPANPAAPAGRYRNHIVGAPVIDDGRVYVAIGEDPEHGDGPGCLWCVDPSRQGDVSAETEAGPNPNSAVIWKYEQFDLDGNRRIDFEETMHRTIGSPAIQDGLLVIADFSGLLHCLDAKTGRLHWTHDLLAACYSTPLIAGGHVYAGDEDGDLTILKLSAEKHLEAEIYMRNSLLGAPIAVDGVLYVLTKTQLSAIAAPTPAPD
jgi:outer membrane protein assembly factor BamB